MPCLINDGLLKGDCEFIIGGVSNIYLANRSEVLGFTTNYTGVTMSGTSSVFYKFETSKNTSSYTEALVVSGNNKNVLQTVDLLVGRSDKDTMDLMNQLVLGNLIAIVETRMNQKYILGETNGLEATVGNHNSGVAEGDNAGIQVTLAGTNLGYGHFFTGVIPQ